MWQFIRLEKSLAVTRTMHLVVTHLNATLVRESQSELSRKETLFSES
jgi:hypothetical protein